MMKGIICGILAGREQEWSQCKYFIYSRLSWMVCWYPEEETHKKDAKKIKDVKKKKILILPPFLCQLVPKIEIIRNTSSNLIMRSILLKNFSSPPLTFIFMLVDWKQLFQTTAALMRTQQEGCSCLRHFIHVYLYTRRGVRAHMGIDVILQTTPSTPKSRDPTTVLGKVAKMAAPD